ncbi:unnamed protein product [Owenia fusiformis]|uniref:Uncharacterized protein n=1 Tax=Owenia fusiformis TaxID=6347 RepID=A0A8J1UMG2_OWEFU|nr:unnamed protein product [Owenia fusiformis]
MTSTVLLKRCVVGLTKSTMPRMMQPQTAAIVNQTFDTRYSYKSCYEKLKVGVQQELLFSQNYIDMEKVNKLMQIRAGHKILTIAGNGTHALSKLLADPEQVIALDVDAPALHMAKLQATGMELLSRNEFCSLIGINRRTVPPNERLKIYEHIRLALEPETAAFWDLSLNYIKDGLLYCGVIDQTVTAFSDSVLPLIHDNSTIQEYLALGNDMNEQIRYHEEIWNSEIWRKEYMIMRNKNMSTVSGPMEDINYGLACLRQYDRVIRHVPNNKNVFLETLLTGDITGKCMAGHLNQCIVIL